MSDRPLFDIQGLSTNDARDYIASLTAHAAQIEVELRRIADDLALWNGRTTLAESAEKPELADQARSQTSALLEKKEALEVERREFVDGLAKLQKDLRLLPLTQRTIDPDGLLDSLEKIAGPTDHVTPGLRGAQAEEALQKLKQRLSRDRPETKPD